VVSHFYNYYVNSYALFNSHNSADWMGVGIFCFFGRSVNPHFAGARNYCDIAPADQGR
jgi:hypothetical protein